MPGIIVRSQKINQKFDKAEDVEEILGQIRNNEDQIETIELKGNSYGIEPLKAIGELLQTCHNLKHLLLNNMFISRLKNEIPQALRYLLGGVKASEARIITLNLSDNAIGPVTMPELLPFLKAEQFTSLKYLYLNNCGLGIKGGQMLSTVLPGLENLTELVIGRNRLEIDGIHEISSALLNLTKLERLELPQNGTKERAIISLCQVLRKNSNMKILNLNDNVLTSTFSELSETLKVLKNLEVLNLGDCLLKTKGAISILSSLNQLVQEQNIPSLKEINLSGNEIGEEVRDIFISTVDCIIEKRSNSNNSPILKIDLSCNDLGEDLSIELRRHYASVIELKIEDDEEQEQDSQNEALNDSTNEPEAIEYLTAEQIETKFQNDINSLAKRFFLVSTKGFQSDKNCFNEEAENELQILITVGKKYFQKSETDFNFLNNLLVACGLMKGEDKSMSPRKDSNLSGPMIALAKFSKRISSDLNQKQCIQKLLMAKVNEEPYKPLILQINSLIYSF